jgi:hypothetical protein
MKGCFEEIRNNKLRDVVQREDQFTFPEFLTLLRQSIGGTRKDVSKEIDISEFLLFKWEHGKFRSPIRTHDMVILSDYYNIPFRLMQNKMTRFLKEVEPACKS